jgi:hypothetical protein
MSAPDDCVSPQTPTPPSPAPGPPIPDFFTAAPRWLNYPANVSKPLTWLWLGYLAPGNVTLLTSQWKTGKTTLLSLLLSRMHCGGTLAGFPVAPCRALVLSEEAQELWDERDRQLNLRDHVCLLSQPFTEGLTFERWNALLDWIAELHVSRGLGLVAIDTVASFLPAGVECHARTAQQCLIALRKLTQRGLAVLLAHHPRKGLTLPGQASRGSGALPAYVDILIEMHGCASAAPDDRRRRLRSFSRHALTPRDLMIEWTADGADYRIPESVEIDDFLQGWEVLRIVLEDADAKLTRRQILDQWPPDYLKPTLHSVWRWLDRACERALIHRDGAGRKNSPFRYWLPAKLEAWQADPFWMLLHSDPFDPFDERQYSHNPAVPPNEEQQPTRDADSDPRPDALPESGAA